MHDTRVFTLGDANYFPGIVALVNSLRLTGHQMPVTVLDTGLEPWQRYILEPHCHLDRARPGEDIFLLKADAALVSGADITLILDSDIMVTGSLAPMIDAAADGNVCTYGDLSDARWFAEWHEALGLRAPLRRGMYVNAGAVAVSTKRRPDFLARWSEVCEQLADVPTMWRSALGPLDPFWLADQDALNALLLSEVPPSAVTRIPWPGMILGGQALARTRVDDVEHLRCSWEGEPVTLLHAVGRQKPWMVRSRRDWRRTTYSVFLRRVLVGTDVEVKVAPHRLPSWLRPGVMSAGVGVALNAYEAGAGDPTSPTASRAVVRSQPDGGGHRPRRRAADTG